MSTRESSTRQAAKRKNQGMNGNLTIGRFGGVELRLNWSLLAVVALIVWSLSDGVFPSQNPGLSHNTYLGMAVVAVPCVVLLVFELPHAVASAAIASVAIPAVRVARRSCRVIE